MRNSICLAGLVLVVLVSSSCSASSVGRRTGSSRSADSEEVATLKAQILELQKRAIVAEVELKRVRKQLADLEADRGLDKTAAAPTRKATVNTSASAGSGGETLERNAPDDSGAVSEGSEVEVSDLRADAPASTRGVADGAAGPGIGQQTGSSSGELTISAQALYDRGYTLFHRGKYIDSETAFQQFLRGYSETVLGDNAQFWIAEARYARGDIDGALAAYRETATRFPDGNKLPDARLKVGDCLRDLGDTEAARQSYRNVIRDHPGSTAASTARERLDRSP